MYEFELFIGENYRIAEETALRVNKLEGVYRCGITKWLYDNKWYVTVAIKNSEKDEIQEEILKIHNDVTNEFK